MNRHFSLSNCVKDSHNRIEINNPWKFEQFSSNNMFSWDIGISYKYLVIYNDALYEISLLRNTP